MTVKLISSLIFIPTIAATLFAGGIKVEFLNGQEHSDFCCSIAPVLGMAHPGITPEWVRARTTGNSADLDLLLALANAQFGTSEHRTFTCTRSSGVRDSIARSIGCGMPVLARRKFAHSGKAVWIVIIGHLDSPCTRLIVNDPRTGAGQEISIDEIGQVYVLE